jgi:hypothetical protein
MEGGEDCHSMAAWVPSSLAVPGEAACSVAVPGEDASLGGEEEEGEPSVEGA